MSYFHTHPRPLLLSLLAGCLTNLPIAPGSTHASPLHEACSQGHFNEVVRLLQDPETDPNTPGKDCQTPLFAACEKGHLAVAQHLLKDIRVNPNTPDIYGCTPLYIASEKGHLDVADHLLKKGSRVDPNLRQEDGCTPFYAACFYGRLDIAERLLKEPRIKPNTPDIYGQTPLDVVRRHMKVAKTQTEWERYNAIWDELVRRGGKFVREKPSSGSSPDKPAPPAGGGQVSVKN